ncbi:MAG: hypothetical protein AAGC68_11525 [Verrucomicrobiota bacterium]
MLLRGLSLFIILFWLASIAWLCVVVWSPPESRMTRIDPRAVYDVFFAWNDNTNMTLLENGRRRGLISVSGGSGTDSETGVFSNLLSVSGSVETPDPKEGSREIDLFWRGVAEFSNELELQTGELTLRIPRRQLSAVLKGKADPISYEVQVKLSGREILNFDSEAGNEIPLDRIPLDSLESVAGVNPMSMQLETEARVGEFPFGGRNLRAYLLVLKPVGYDQSIRVFLSEAGEPLKIETGFGFEAVSEILVPLEAYQRPNTTSADDSD